MKRWACMDTFQHSGTGVLVLWGFEPQGHLVTLVAASPGALSQLVAATDSVWPPQQLRRHIVLQVVCLWKWSEVNWRSVLHLVVFICVRFIHLYMSLGVCVLMVSTCVYECVGGCAHVVMFRCPGWVWKPVVSVVASVTLTVSPSTQELLSHAACFCQCWAEGVTPQRFAAPCVCAADGCRWSCTCIFPAEQTAPCWLPRTVKRSVSWSD